MRISFSQVVKSAFAAILFSMAQTAYANDSGLAARWLITEGFGQLVWDTSGNWIIGARGSSLFSDANDPAWVRTVSGDSVRIALRFGGDDFVTFPRTPVLEPQQITVETRVKSPSSPGPFRYIAAKGAQDCTVASYGLYTGFNGGLVFYIFDGTNVIASADAGPAVWDGNYHHVAGTYDGNAVRLYVDGVEVGVGNASSAPIAYGLSTSNRFYLGAFRGTCDLPFIGDIERAWIWSRALTPGEIATRSAR
jgi:hypothetical protein